MRLAPAPKAALPEEDEGAAALSSHDKKAGGLSTHSGGDMPPNGFTVNSNGANNLSDKENDVGTPNLKKGAASCALFLISFSRRMRTQEGFGWRLDAAEGEASSSIEPFPCQRRVEPFIPVGKQSEVTAKDLTFYCFLGAVDVF